MAKIRRALFFSELVPTAGSRIQAGANFKNNHHAEYCGQKITDCIKYADIGKVFFYNGGRIGSPPQMLHASTSSEITITRTYPAGSPRAAFALSIR